MQAVVFQSLVCFEMFQSQPKARNTAGLWMSSYWALPRMLLTSSVAIFISLGDCYLCQTSNASVSIDPVEIFVHHHAFGSYFPSGCSPGFLYILLQFQKPI